MSEPHFNAAEGAQARTELREYLRARTERRRIFPIAILVGLCAGLLAVAFRAALAAADSLRDHLIEWAHHVPAGWLFVMLFSGALTAGAFLIVRRGAPETAGSGIPHLELVLHRHRTLNWKRVLPLKFIGGTLAIGSGMALGREGPTVQMGGAVGTGVARGLKRGKHEELILSAAGAGAGLAAAFNAPLAGLVFVLEELQRDFRPVVFGAAFVAAATADVVSRAFSGQLPVFTVPAYATPPLAALPIFALLGVFAGLVGPLFNRSLIGTMNGFARLGTRWAFPAAIAVGATVGLIAYFNPTVVGGGHEVATNALLAKTALTAVPLLFLLRFVMSMASYGTGVPGGIFAPLLALGALLGLAVGGVAHGMMPAVAPDAGAFAVVGMAALFTGIVRAPLTGVVLIGEMTSSYSQMLPLILACFVAYAVAEAMGDLPVYEALLQRDLLRSGGNTHYEEPIVLELEVEPGAPFDGHLIRELGLPSGVVFIAIRHGDREIVPRADVRLEAYERITAVISPDSEKGLEAFRHGCEAE